MVLDTLLSAGGDASTWVRDVAVCFEAAVILIYAIIKVWKR